MPEPIKKDSMEKILADAQKLQDQANAERVLAKAAQEEEQAGAAVAETAVAETPAAPEAAPPAKAPVEEVSAKPTKDAEKLDKAIDSLEDDEAEIKPDAKGIVTLPFKAFERRVSRAGKAALKAVFGTDNREEILKMKKDYEGMLAAQDAERRAKLDEVTRANEDRDKALEKLRLIEEKERARAEAAEAEMEETKVNSIAVKYLDEAALELAHFKFAKHLKRKTEEELADYSADQIEEWYKKFADKNPKYAKQTPPPPPQPPKVALNVGATDLKKPSSKAADPNVKTPVPGKSNSMTNAEWAAYKRQHGISY